MNIKVLPSQRIQPNAESNKYTTGVKTIEQEGLEIKFHMPPHIQIRLLKTEMKII